MDRHDNRPAISRTFAFVSWQNANQGAQNAYRRIIYEDAHAPENQRLGFVFHVGDLSTKIGWYPEDRPRGMYDGRRRDIVRYENGAKIADFHIPTTVDDYRAVALTTTTAPKCRFYVLTNATPPKPCLLRVAEA